MHVLCELPSSLVWPSPKVCPISWHMTCCFSSGLLYADRLKYVSFILSTPFVMWLPLIQIWARPSQPLAPYFALHTWTMPAVALQLRPALLLTTVLSNSLDTRQSVDAVWRYESHVDDTLSPSLIVKGFEV